MRHHKITSQTFRVITQYGDMLVVRQGVQSQPNPHHPHHHHHHQTAGHASASGKQHLASSSSATSAASTPTTATSVSTGATATAPQSGEQQSTSRPIIMTFHDLGLNSELQFATFCECDEVKLMLQTFTIIHVNFIGQEFNSNGQPASSLPEDFRYPTVEQMAECIVDICAQLRVRSFIGLAVGAGAHIVSALALLRPDLVHGLFLINPVLSSCSITEWLCFKMSAIASNHPLTNSAHGPLAPNAKQQSHHHHHQSASSDHESGGKPASSALGRHSPDRHNASSGLRKLWNAVHHHHHHSSHSSSTHSSITSKHEPLDSAAAARLETLSLRSDQTAASGDQSVASSMGEGQLLSSSPPDSSVSPAQHHHHHQQQARPAAGYRLRQLILSRNFRLGKHQHQNHDTLTESREEGGATTKSAPPPPPPQQQHKRRQSITNSIDTQMDVMQKEVDSNSVRRRFSGGSSSLAATSGPAAPTSPTGRSVKRPPIEYLMYHHFGSASFQRFRRPSATSSELTAGNEGADSLGHQASTEELGASNKQHRSSCSSSGSGNSQSAAAAAAAAAVAANLMLRRSAHRNSRDNTSGGGGGGGGNEQESPTGKSHTDSPHGGGGGGGRSRRSHKGRRSNSVSLASQHLASIENDRQRLAYMQMVYKHYFTQINAHNLWLFAQSFIKRRTLNLRKDCGAAAHAAAAAAALGTSICAAFVGVAPAPGSAANPPQAQPPPPPPPSSSSRIGADDSLAPDVAQAFDDEKKRSLLDSDHGGGASANCAGQRTSKQQSAVVAGTKVKRTFTCQTLIMCSSVQIHSERALKLMALLNPLQATWIKTDQTLVLEEKPEKVCQALRLFLQGIGYSMSTYERRLRLSSAQASFSSADSTGSMRSSGESTPASLQHQAKPPPAQTTTPAAAAAVAATTPMPGDKMAT